MTDGFALRCFKRVVRSMWALEYGIRRRGPAPPWKLEGICHSCAKCCEMPTIQVGPATMRISLLRRLFLLWQRRINGFDLVETDGDAGTMSFRCAHFDWSTRRCDSYASRPWMCRDYPRGLMDQPWPELFEGCGYRVQLRKAEGLSAALDQTGLSAEQLAELKRKLRLE